MPRKRTPSSPDELPLRLRPLTSKTATTLSDVLGQLCRDADAHEAATAHRRGKQRSAPKGRVASYSAESLGATRPTEQPG